MLNILKYSTRREIKGFRKINLNNNLALFLNMRKSKTLQMMIFCEMSSNDADICTMLSVKYICVVLQDCMFKNVNPIPSG